MKALRRMGVSMLLILRMAIILFFVSLPDLMIAYYGKVARLTDAIISFLSAVMIASGSKEKYVLI